MLQFLRYQIYFCYRPRPECCCFVGPRFLYPISFKDIIRTRLIEMTVECVETVLAHYGRFTEAAWVIVCFVLF